jgi:glycosyltransferase involved in cell wall biosynthesis
MTASAGNPAVGYLVSEYPAPSHTFIRREIEALRGAGVPIVTYSVRPPAHVLSNPRERQAAAETFVVLRAGAVRIASANLAALVRRPGRYLSTLGLALRHRVPGLRSLLWALFHLAEAVMLAQRMRADGVARLHNHFGNAGATVGLLAAHFNGVPWSLTLHGISEFDYPAGNLLPEKLERADFAACVSYFGMAQAMRLTRPRLWHKLRVVRCGLDPADLPSAARNHDEGILRVICVGRLSPEKGHIGLFQAVQRLAARGVTLHLTLVGDGPMRAQLEEATAQMGLADRIEFLGARDEPATLEAIAQADMLVLPSFMEGLPIVLMEAMALHVPVIASRVAGIPELVIDGETGLLFDPANWDGLADALARLAADPQLRGDLADAGFAKVSGAFFHPAAAAPMIPLLAREARAIGK